MNLDRLLTMCKLSLATGVPEWRLRQLQRAGVFSPTGKVGKWAVFAAAEVPAIRQRLAEAGYLKLQAEGDARG
jgi:hypothetical protein